MGATPEQKPGPPEQNEYPVHKVSLTDYYIAKYQVTQDLWEAVMGNNPSEHKGNPRYPVDNINWNDSQKFVEALNKGPVGVRGTRRSEGRRLSLLRKQRAGKCRMVQRKQPNHS